MEKKGQQIFSDDGAILDISSVPMTAVIWQLDKEKLNRQFWDYRAVNPAAIKS